MDITPEDYTDDPTTKQLVARLFEVGQKLPDDLREALLAAGSALDEALVALLEDEWAADSDAPGGGWASVHAASIAGKRQPPGAIEPLIEILSRMEWDTYLHNSASIALQKYGEQALEPVWHEYEAAPDADAAHVWLNILASLGVHQKRIYDELLDLLAKKPDFGATLLSIYGDPRAIDPLSKALGRTLIDWEGPAWHNHQIIEMAAAIEELGGTLTPTQQAKLEQVRHIFRTQSQPAGRRPKPPALADSGEKLGRNDPCWCGSGKKYKRCHWVEDRR